MTTGAGFVLLPEEVPLETDTLAEADEVVDLLELDAFLALGVEEREGVEDFETGFEAGAGVVVLEVGVEDLA